MSWRNNLVPLVILVATIILGKSNQKFSADIALIISLSVVVAMASIYQMKISNFERLN